MVHPTAARRSTRRRSPREGSIYRSADGRWRGALAWTLGDGRQARRYVSAPTSDEARAKLDVLRAKLRLGTLTTSSVTVADYLSRWIERDKARVRPATSRQRESHVRVYLIPTLGRTPLSRLTPADVEQALALFMDSGRPQAPGARRGRPVRPISPLTARHIRATLRRALGEAVRDGLVGRNAAGDAAAPYVPHRPVAYLEAPMVRRLLDATADDQHGPLYALAATTGLRLGEMLGLTWSAVDLLAGTLTVRQTLARDGKGGWCIAEPKSARSRRTLTLPATARLALQLQRERQNVVRDALGATWQDTLGLVFTDEVGRPCDPHRVSAAFQRDRQAAGVPRIRFHDLRHSAATLLLAEGVPLAVISELLGHAGIAITAAHYAAIVPTLRQDAADAMDRALRGGS